MKKLKSCLFLTFGAVSLLTGVIGCSSDDKKDDDIDVPTIPDDGDDEEYDIITIEEAIALCTSETPTEERYYLKGTITEISNFTYGEMTIEDDTGSIYVYGTYSSDGVLRYSEMSDKPVKGDEVIIYGTLCLYNSTPEVKSGWIISFIHNDVEIDENEYKEVSIAQSRELEDESKVKLQGYVAQITYAFGMVADGIFLVDNTNSIYVYSKDLAAQVKVGNKITIYGTKTHYILDSEKTNASKFGYKGCLQVIDPILKENDNVENDIDFSWCDEKTIKDIMETDVANDITTTIYKTTAVVKKQEGSGFVNYYIDDLDNETGSYVYTRCSGSDLDWLEEFNGKICTVYLSIMNAKSSSSGCVWRFMPIVVKDENYIFDVSKAPRFALDYYVLDQFESLYTGDPILNVITSVSSSLLNFEGVEISYTSSNTDVIDFKTEDDSLIMHAYSDGNTTINVKAKYEEYEASEEVQIEVKFSNETSAITVKEALDGEFNSEYTLKGVVGPAMTNKVGFYLIDETGSIGVLTTSDEMSSLSIGNTIYVTGEKIRSITTNSDNGTNGTTVINATKISNSYGKVDYSTSSFVSTTLSEINSFEVNYETTEKIYTLNASLKKVESTYYSNVYLKDGDEEALLYSSSGSQYSWATQYVDSEDDKFDMEVAIVNFNGKQKPILLSLTLDDGEKLICSNNFKS